MLATLRQTGRRSLALFLLLAVLLGGAVEAVACEPMDSSAVASAMSEPDSDKDAPADQPEQHALCAHGHCHHGAQNFGNTPSSPAFQPVETVLVRRPDNAPKLQIIDLPKRPPRA